MPDPNSYTLTQILSLQAGNWAEPAVIINILIMIALLFCAALISAAEVAFFSLEPIHMQEIKKSKTKTDDLVFDLLMNPKKLIATLLISINFTNIGIVIASTYLTDTLFTFPSEFAKFLYQVVVLTFLILIAGEVIPKIYASRNPLKTLSIMAVPVFWLQRIFYPVSSFMIFSTKLIDNRIKKKQTNISVEELEHALELTTNESHQNDNEHKILKGIVRFGNTDVKQIMTPRVDLVSLEKSEKFTDVINTITESGFSRIPVYEDGFDNITGILVTKDLLKYLDSDEAFDWSVLCRSPYFVPESKKIDDLLKEFQTKKIHMAIVVDEFGGASGVVTMEDIIEEIVGDISDEFDDDELVFSQLDDDNYVFEGKTPLNDLYRVLNINGDEFEEVKGESDTLAGFIIELKGKIPRKGEKLTFQDLLFTVEAADKRRVKQIKVTLLNQVEKKENE